MYNTLQDQWVILWPKTFFPNISLDLFAKYLRRCPFGGNNVSLTATDRLRFHRNGEHSNQKTNVVGSG